MPKSNDEKIISKPKGLSEKLPNLFITGSIDIPFLALTIALLTFGLIMLFSASYPYAYYNRDHNSYYFGNTLDMLTNKWKFGAMSDQDAGYTKKLLLAGVAKLYSKSNRFEFGNAKSINPKALPQREVRDEDDET